MRIYTVWSSKSMPERGFSWSGTGVKEKCLIRENGDYIGLKTGTLYEKVVFCSLFGAMIDLPEHFPMFCMDIMQLKKYFSVDKIPIEQKNEHSALADAEWNKKAYEWLEIL